MASVVSLIVAAIGATCSRIAEIAGENTGAARSSMRTGAGRVVVMASCLPSGAYHCAVFTQIDYAVSDHVATITLNRPDKLNAFTNTMMREMLAAFDQIDADDDVRVVIVTGAGRGFCAGADLSGGGGTFAAGGGGDVSGPDRIPRDGGGLVSLRIFELTKPIIAAINGPAVGVGITMTLPMDIRMASSNAKIGFVFAKRGIVPEACSSWFLPRVVGISKAMEWVATGRVFTADEAHAAGLVRSVHAPDDLLPAAQALAAEMASETAPVSVALSRQMLWRMLGADHPMEAHRVDSRAIAERGKSADSREGVTSFLEKRAATYPDKVSDGLPAVFPDWTDREFS
jgi:enoyl-CoA hydratase/carnithine racemase